MARLCDRASASSSRTVLIFDLYRHHGGRWCNHHRPPWCHCIYVVYLRPLPLPSLCHPIPPHAIPPHAMPRHGMPRYDPSLVETRGHGRTCALQLERQCLALAEHRLHSGTYHRIDRAIGGYCSYCTCTKDNTPKQRAESCVTYAWATGQCLHARGRVFPCFGCVGL